jgi:hypothetical protein
MIFSHSCFNISILHLILVQCKQYVLVSNFYFLCLKDALRIHFDSTFDDIYVSCHCGTLVFSNNHVIWDF